jgi:type I restriction enzyme S subunit
MSNYQIPSYWNKTKIGEICSFTTGKLNSEQAVRGGKYPFFTCSKEIFAINSYSFDQEAVLLAGNNAQGIYDVKYYKGKFDAYQRTYVISVNSPNELDYYFLLYSLTLQLDFLRNQSLGATTKFLTATIIKNLEIPLPPLPEQRAIACALQAVQRAKETRQRELELERERKAALMDYLFTHGTRGESLKQTEIGEMPESWEESKLGDTCNITTGTTPATNKSEYYDGQIAFIKTSEIANKRIKESQVYINEKAVADYNLKIYPIGTVFVAMYGQGKTRGQSALLEIPATTTQNTAAIVASNKLEPLYLWQWLLSQYNKLREIGSQGHISHLNLSYVKSYKMALPSLYEQKEIAEILYLCDIKTNSLEKEISLLDELFQAMLEELMTGQLSAIPLIED